MIIGRPEKINDTVKKLHVRKCHTDVDRKRSTDRATVSPLHLQPKVWFPKPFFGNLKTPHIIIIIIDITTIIVINITTIMVIIIMVIISKVKGPYMASRGRGLIFSYEGEREWSKRTLRPIITS